MMRKSKWTKRIMTDGGMPCSYSLNVVCCKLIEITLSCYTITMQPVNKYVLQMYQLNC